MDVDVYYLIYGGILLFINFGIVIHHLHSFNKTEQKYNSPLKVFKLKSVYRVYICMPLFNSIIAFLATAFPREGIWILFLVQLLNPIAWTANYYHIQLALGGKKEHRRKLWADRDVPKLAGFINIQFMCKVYNRFLYQSVLNIFAIFLWAKPIFILIENIEIENNKDTEELIILFTLLTIIFTGLAVIGAVSTLKNVEKFIMVDNFDKKFILSILLVPFYQLQEAFINQLVLHEAIPATNELTAKEHSFRWHGIVLALESVVLNIAYYFLYAAADFAELDNLYRTRHQSSHHSALRLEAHQSSGRVDADDLNVMQVDPRPSIDENQPTYSF